MRLSVLLAVLLAVGLGLAVTTSEAGQNIGTLTWLQSPFCNKITLTVVLEGPVAMLAGFDDLCGAAQRAPVYGTAVANLDGSFAMGLTEVVNGFNGVSTYVTLSPSTLAGTWSDDAGNTGNWVPQ